MSHFKLIRSNRKSCISKTCGCGRIHPATRLQTGHFETPEGLAALAAAKANGRMLVTFEATDEILDHLDELGLTPETLFKPDEDGWWKCAGESCAEGWMQVTRFIRSWPESEMLLNGFVGLSNHYVVSGVEVFHLVIKKIISSRVTHCFICADGEEDQA